MIIRYLYCLCAMLLTTVYTTEAQITCKIEGTVINRPNSTKLYLAPYGTDFRVHDPIEIPIQNGTFQYTLNTTHPQLYNLTFVEEYLKGSWRPTDLMVENETITVKLFTIDSAEMNIVKGGELNKRYHYLKNEPRKIYSADQLYENVKSMDKNGTLYSQELYKWINEINQVGEDRAKLDSLLLVKESIETYSSEGNEIMEQIKVVRNLETEWLINEIKNNIDIVGLAVLSKNIESTKSVLSYSNDESMRSLLKQYTEIYKEKYSEKFRDNPMSVETDMIINSMEINKYIDFTAPDINGKEHKLSDLIDGKVAVIDLWASWCGPCMRTSKSFIPIYEKYKDKGFTIVGVAREKDDTKAMEAAIERIGMSWLNLVELNDRASIWAKYGAGNSGGKVILVDKTGNIIATDFNDVDLENHLQKLLK